MEYVFEGKQIVVALVCHSWKKNLMILGNGFTLQDPGFSFPKAKHFCRYGTTVALFFKKECEGLEAAQEELASFVNEVYDDYKKVILYGHSKCGVMFYNTLSLLDRPVTSISVSAPFGGTFWADAKNVKKVLWASRNFGGKVRDGWKYWLYQKIFSNHKVDQDIIPGSEYLEKERSIPECHNVANVISTTNKWPFSALNTLASFEDGDGIVSLETQKNQRIQTELYVKASHATSFNKAKIVLASFAG